MSEPSPPIVTVSLPSRGPSRAEALLAFLGARAIPGLESYAEGRFRRHLSDGWLELALPADPAAHQLDLHLSLDPHRSGARPPVRRAGPTAERTAEQTAVPTVEGTAEQTAGPTVEGTAGRTAERTAEGTAGRTAERTAEIVALVRRVADLDTDLDPVAEALGADDDLAVRLAAVGLSRRPGTFDPFELAVRAVVGQQISVAAARTLLARLLALVDPMPVGSDDGDGPPHRRSFPSPDQVARAPLDSLGMPSRRRATITGLARAAAGGELDLGPDAEPERLRRQLLALPGIGPWTAGYIALRLGGDGDGWPTGDLVLRQSLGTSAAELERRADRWRPWRSYAALLLWRTAAPAVKP